MPLLSLKSNPLWAGRQLLLHAGPAHAPALWDYDSSGFASPSNGRELGSEEADWLNQYNSQRKELNEASRKAIDAVMERLFPLSDACFKELPDIKATAITEDVRWLHDHPAGSDFYTSGKNGWMSDIDAEGDWRLGRLTRYLKEAELSFNIEEISEKVGGGISTPIVINLDGKGVATTSLLSDKTVLFDMDGDGIKDETAWVSGNNAFLAIDRNGNGAIDDVSELFGGKNRAAGFAKLAEFDSNGDGKIDRHDARSSELLLWHDKNINGMTDEGELYPAWAAGLDFISLDYISQDVCQNGNLFGEASSAVYQDRQVDVVDVYFRFRPAPDPYVEKWWDAPAGILLPILIMTGASVIDGLGYIFNLDSSTNLGLGM